MTRYTYHKPTREEIDYVGERMRFIDTLECQMAIGKDGVEALDYCIATSIDHWLIKKDGVPLCLFGVAPFQPPNVGSFWMLGTGYMEKIMKGFLTEAVSVLSIAHTWYPSLIVEVADVNTQSHAFLRRIGFKPYQLLDDDFHPTSHLIRTD